MAPTLILGQLGASTPIAQDKARPQTALNNTPTRINDSQNNLLIHRMAGSRSYRAACRIVLSLDPRYHGNEYPELFLLRVLALNAILIHIDGRTASHGISM